MKASLEYLRESFARYNDLCFGGVLPEPEFRLGRGERTLGKLEYSRRFNFWGKVVERSGFILRINASKDLPQDVLDDVIIHEMIHYRIALSGEEDRSAHGPLFRSMMKDINSRFGRHVVISHKSADAGVEGPSRKRIVAVSLLREGEHGITVCASTRLNRIGRGLRLYFGVREVRWYLSDNPFFARYPRSLTPKLYKVSEEELSRALQGAEEMKKEGSGLKPKPSVKG